MKKVLWFFGFILLFQSVTAQCPTYNKRNNGQGAGTCLTGDSPPASSSIKSGSFSFNSGNTNLLVDSVYLNGQKYQAGSTLFGLATIWFGGFNSPTKDMCFYGTNNNDNAVPAGRWKFFLKDNSTNTQIGCEYTINSGGTVSNLSPGTISCSKTSICVNTSPPAFTSVSASGCSNPGVPSYQWQSSTTSSTSGFTNMSGRTSDTLNPGTLTQTTYYKRNVTCSNDATVSSTTDVIQITVSNPGILSPSSSSILINQTAQFSTNGTTGGTWSSANTAIAQVGVSGLVTGMSAGSTTIRYTVMPNDNSTCVASANITVSATLPVTFGQFEALRKGNGILLNWETFQEVGTKNFYIQRSDDAQIWKDIAIVNATGNSNNLSKYSFFDNRPGKLNFYRLQQNDLDGKWSYSKTVYIEFDYLGFVGSNSIISKNRSFTFFSERNQDFIIVNMNGVTVMKGKFFAGQNQVATNFLPHGFYHLVSNQIRQRILVL